MVGGGGLKFESVGGRSVMAGGRYLGGVLLIQLRKKIKCGGGGGSGKKI